jgi:hypothetical protein
LGLDRLRETRHETPEELATALEGADGMPGDADERAGLAMRIATVLALDQIKSSAKAIDLLYSSERNLITARIVTELRPVFGEDPRRSRESGGAAMRRRRSSCFSSLREGAGVNAVLGRVRSPLTSVSMAYSWHVSRPERFRTQSCKAPACSPRSDVERWPA